MSTATLNLLEAYISHPSHDNLSQLVDQGLAFWVDWGEYDEDIVDYVAQRLQDSDELSAEMMDADNERGFDMVISYNGHDSVIPYDEDQSERDLALQATAKAVSHDYGLRFCRFSVGGDTLAFIVLPWALWDALENKESRKKVTTFFQPIDEFTDMFELSFNQVQEITQTLENYL